MIYKANRNININKGARIKKDQLVKVYRAITNQKTPLSEVVLENSSFFTPTSLVNKFFTKQTETKL